MTVKLGNQEAAVGDVAEVGGQKRGCAIPASEGGTGASATAGPTRGPAGTTPIGGGVGGGKVGTPTGSPMVGGGMIGWPVILNGGAGAVGLPLPNVGCSTPGADGGTGAGSMAAPVAESVTLAAI